MRGAKRRRREIDRCLGVEVLTHDAANEDPSARLARDVSDEPTHVITAPGLRANHGPLGPRCGERMLAQRADDDARRLHEDLAYRAHRIMPDRERVLIEAHEKSLLLLG